jgi:hypothetical protein
MKRLNKEPCRCRECVEYREFLEAWKRQGETPEQTRIRHLEEAMKRERT